MNPAQPSMIEMFMPFVVMIGVFWFLIIRPQGKKAKEHDSFLQSLKRGDAVITNSGMLGVVDGLTESVVTLEIANGVKAKFLRKQISGLQASLEKSTEKTPVKA